MADIMKSMSGVRVRTRTAPSPTGNLHLGTAYATLWPYLFARQNGGDFILRLEDTDVDRGKKEFEESILEGLKWLGFSWDEGPYYQTKRLKNYEEGIKKLLDTKTAYYCFCTIEELEKEKKEQQEKKIPQVYSGKCRNLHFEQVKENIGAGKEKVVRFKMPEDRGKISWDDMLHGKISYESSLIGDFIIRRTNGMPLYNFAVVVDDIDMKISHVIRGDDHLSNTPKQIVLFEALSAELPLFAHYPTILNPDRVGKLSKRAGAKAVGDYQKEGYLSEAIVNYIGTLGFTMPGEVEIFSMEEMKEIFDIKLMRLSPAAFNEEKLNWINGEYIRKLSNEELTKKMVEFLPDHPLPEKIAPLIPLIKERIKTLSDFVPLTDFIFEKPDYDKTIFKKIIKNRADKDIQDLYGRISEKIEKLKKPFQPEEFEKTFKEMADDENFSNGDFFQLLRLGVSGQLITPPLFECIQILGEEETISRLKYVAQNYSNFVDEVEKDLDITTDG